MTRNELIERLNLVLEIARTNDLYTEKIEATLRSLTGLQTSATLEQAKATLHDEEDFLRRENFLS